MNRRSDINKAAEEPNLKGLQSFIVQRDRKPPPADLFTGREKEIAALTLILKEVARSPESSAGATRVIYGAPGVGKTALLAELKRRWKDTATVVQVKASAFADPWNIVAAVLTAMAPDHADAWLGRTSRQTAGGAQATLGVGLPGVGSASMQGGGQKAMTQELRPQVSDLSDIPRVLPDFNQPIVLMVDEAQNLADQGKGAENLLASLHEGTDGLRLLPVLAGLGNTPDVLEELGLSRMSHKSSHLLAAFSEAECFEAIEKFCVKFRVPMSKEWVTLAVNPRITNGEREIDGWPMHLRNNLAGIAQAVVNANGNLSKAPQAEAKAFGKAAREEYYVRRISVTLQKIPETLTRVISLVQQSPAPMLSPILNEIQAALIAEGRDTDAPEQAQELLDEMIKKGVLHQDPVTQGYRCPIPSLAAYIQNKYGQNTHDDTIGGAPAIPFSRDRDAESSPGTSM